MGGPSTTKGFCLCGGGGGLLERNEIGSGWGPACVPAWTLHMVIQAEGLPYLGTPALNVHHIPIGGN